MPALTPRTPSYRLHKPSGRAVVTLDGRDNYFGELGTPTSQAEYDRLLAEWLTHDRRLPAPGSGPADLTINEMLVVYLRHADEYYVKNGWPTHEHEDIRSALRPVRRLAGTQKLAEPSKSRGKSRNRVRENCRKYSLPPLA